MDYAVVISSSDDENNSKITRQVLPKKKITKTKLPKKKAISTVILNDDGDDEEFQLDIHTKTREELEEQKSIIPLPKSLPTKGVDKPLPKLVPKSTETDVVLQTNPVNTIPKPLLPNLTITPVTKTNESPYLKVKNIDALKYNKSDQVEANSTLEINQSTNLFIVNSDQNPSAILQEALQKLSQQKSDIIVSKTPETPFFQITNVHTLSNKNTETTIKRKSGLQKYHSKSKRIKLNENSNSEIITLVDSENAIDTISLDSDSDNDTKTENDIENQMEIVSNVPPDDENSEDVVCIENDVEKIDICSSSDTDNENVKENQLKTVNEQFGSEYIQSMDTSQLQKLQEKIKKKLKKRVGANMKAVETQNSNLQNGIEDVSEVLNQNKVKNSKNTELNEHTGTNTKTVATQNTEKLQKTQEVEEFKNLQSIEKLENTEKSVKSKEPETQSRIQLENTKKSEELDNSEKRTDLQKDKEDVSDVLNQNKVENSKNTELNKHSGTNTKTVETQNNETTEILQKSQEIEELKNLKSREKLENTEKSVKSKETQSRITLENTKKSKELENSEKRIDIQNDKEFVSEVLNQNNAENSNNTELQIKTANLIELQNNNEVEIQNPKKIIQLQSPEKIIDKTTKNRPQLKIVLERIDVNEFEKIDSQKEDENDEIGDNEILFEKFLETCSSESVPNKYRLIINESIKKIRKRFENANINYLNSNNFSQLLNNKIKEILVTPISATVAFSEVLMDLKINKRENDDDSNNMDKKTLMKIKKLETMLKLLNKKISQLEQAEMSIGDDWDENASYLKEDRYKRKSCQIYKKICELHQKDANAGRLTLMKINFQGSKYPKINQAINKLYNKKRQFPNLHDITKCVKKCVERNKLKLTESQVDLEAREMFKLLGNKLQKRRQKETYQNLMSYSKEIVLEDPASKDIELEKKLRESHKEAHTRIEEIINKFVQKQDSGEDTCLNDRNNSSEQSDSDASEEDSTGDEKND